MNFANLLSEYKPYSDFFAALEKGKTPISISGMTESASPQFIYQSSIGRGALAICYSEVEAMRLYDELKLYTENVHRLPVREYLYHNVDARNRESEFLRLCVLSKINTDSIIVASIEAVLGVTLPEGEYNELCMTLSCGGELDVEEFAKKLAQMGYTREDMVESKGQFSVRGGIADVFSPQAEFPVRIELFDTEIDSIREFDPMTQRTVEVCDCTTIIPAREIVLSDAKKSELISILKKKTARLKNEDLKETVTADIELLENAAAAIDRYIPYIYPELPTILDYLPEESVIFLFEPKRANERGKTIAWEENEILDGMIERGILFPKSSGYKLAYNELCKRLQKSTLVSINSLTHSTIDFSYNSIFEFNTKSTVSLHGKIEYLFDDIAAWTKQSKTVIILAANRSRGENLAGILNEKGYKAVYCHDGGEFEKGSITVIRGVASKGFEYPEIDFVLVAEQDIFEAARKRTRRSEENTNRLKSYTDISVGDYVVHRTNGIGCYMGISKMSVGGVTKDYLKIAYQGTDVLYVPVEQMDMLYKYIGGSDKPVKLSKLGGSEWNKTKQRVKTACADMAKQLVSLYAERANTKGYAFSGETPWMRDFEDSFSYTETEDQLRSIEEVRDDMTSPKPMDRLLCGDVGYGKTEVALRAAFRAATDSKQVAYLCPTTILAMQQYENFKKRMAEFPIKVEMLSRFRTPKQQENIIKQLKTGEIDIVIGTHKLLQESVQFKDLGLLIVDEEQRFGVAHKERLKEIKKNIDVLSMSATPIPRTLHMAMISVRDMSLLQTPPENRYPVETFVLEHNDLVIADAIKRELARGGQVFYLYNRVKGIYQAAQQLKRMLPDANISVAHGKMNEEQLEDIMYDMVNGDIDVLVCTTIIETGLDIPNANTIIVENADRMGLSQLYQLRGRVGRSNRSAYAYFTYKKDKVMSETAQKRLSAIREFTEFGSGFKIAMRDLEIRGAGNILGSSQHGHMETVGYDMYCKLLSESIREAKGEKVTEEAECTIDINIDAYIPERYIKNHNQRIDIYKRIAAVCDEDGVSDLTDELIDRFGELPRAVINLIDVSHIKHLAIGCNITEISVKGENVIFSFSENGMDAELAVGIAAKFTRDVKLGSGKVATLSYRNREPKKLLSNIKFVLHTINQLKNTKD